MSRKYKKWKALTSKFRLLHITFEIVLIVKTPTNPTMSRITLEGQTGQAWLTLLSPGPHLSPKPYSESLSLMFSSAASGMTSFTGDLSGVTGALFVLPKSTVRLDFLFLIGANFGGGILLTSDSHLGLKSLPPSLLK